MDLSQAMKEAEAGYSLLLSRVEETEMQAYISDVLKRHAKGELEHEFAIDNIMTLCVLINCGDGKRLKHVLNMFNQQKNGGNLPSKTGNPSGKGRGNVLSAS